MGVANNVAVELDDRSLQLVTEYYPLACAIAKRTHARLPKGIDLDDLVSTAVMGLIDAADRFDPARGFAFKSYAKHRIQGAILDSLRANDWVPRAVRRRADRIDHARSTLRERLDRPPTSAELASHLGLDVEEVHALMRDADTRPLLSLDAPIDGDTETSLVDLICADNTPDRSYEENEARQAAVDAIAQLPERERVALVLFYFHELSLKEVGTVLSVSESRACQLCGQAIKRLRSRLHCAA